MKSALLKASVGLNLALASVVGLKLLRAPQAAPAGVAAWTAPSAATGVSLEQRIQVVEFVTNQFQWKRLSSPDLKAYVANLRRAGCPENTIGDIICAEAGRVYAVKAAAVGGVSFWSCGPEREAAERRREEVRRELEGEKQGVLDSLRGPKPAWTEQQSDEFVGLALVNFLLGPVPAGVDEQVAACIQESERRSDQIKDEAEHVLLPEDQARLDAERTNVVDQIKALLTPAQFDEFALRLSAVQLMNGLDDFSGTPAEMREIARTHAQVFGLFNYGDFEVLGHSDGTPEQGAEFRARLKTALGEARFVEFARASDREFEEIDNFLTERSLGSGVSLQLYQLKQLATAEHDRVAEQHRVPAEERLSQLRQVQAQTCSAVGQVLGSDLLRAYLANGAGSWLTNLSRL